MGGGLDLIEILDNCFQTVYGVDFSMTKERRVVVDVPSKTSSSIGAMSGVWN